MLFGLSCRRRHADVLEFIWLLNSHAEVTFSWMHGDKDAYRLAFHMANKSADFAQVCTSVLVCLEASFATYTPDVCTPWNSCQTSTDPPEHGQRQSRLCTCSSKCRVMSTICMLLLCWILRSLCKRFSLCYMIPMVWLISVCALFLDVLSK